MNFASLTPHLEDSDRIAQLSEIESDFVEHEFPPQLVVENTSYCNLKCVHCSHKDFTRPHVHMDRNLWDKIVMEVGENYPNTELWPTFYGEALILGDELWDRLKFAEAAGCTNLVLNSNGMLLKRFHNIDKVLTSPLKRFILSLDGFTRETFEAVRARAKWDVVYPAVEELLLRRQPGQPRIIVQFSVFPENAHEWPAFRDYWSKRGAEVKVRPQLEWTGTKPADTISKGHEFRIACPWANNTMAIHADGRVVACAVDFDAGYVAGNINKVGVQEAWKELKKLRDVHRSHDWQKLPAICKGCNDWQVAGAEMV